MEDHILQLIDRQRPGWSLEQDFYQDRDIFAVERGKWLSRQWMLMAHISEIPDKGSFIVRDLFGESVVIVRTGTSANDVKAYYNVCTHRGSRLCKTDGRAPLIVCPYHAWSFKLTGELQSQQDLPEGVEASALSLHELPTYCVEGAIFCAQPGEQLPDPAPAFAAFAPALKMQGLADARIIARKSYPTNANWKLVIENAFECYHCRPSHPEYFGANGHVAVSAVRDGARAESWNEEVARFQQESDFGAVLYDASQDVDTLDTMPCRVLRQPIGGGRKSLSRDGEPVSSLMGEFSRFDGGETQIRFGRLSFASCANDYITLFQILPVSADRTDMVLTWLVGPDSPADVDADAISWMWDVTTLQDKRIIEDNAAGVSSSAYRPGPYTALESATANFVTTYLQQMRSAIGANGI